MSTRKGPSATPRPAGNCGSSGSSLMEMVVVLVILSLLAAVATPYARKTLRREKEMQLRETLRTVKIAIDRFHADVDRKVRAARKGSTAISENGYPLSLQVLINGAGKTPETRYANGICDPCR